MSVTREEQVRCQCGTAVRVVVADALDAVAHPHLRQALLDGALHRFTCGACGAPLLVDKPLVYLDTARRHFFVVAPRRELAHEPQALALTRQLFEMHFGPQTTAAEQALGGEMMVRLCFGLPALREKVVADEAQLNDLALEALKCEVLGQLPELQQQGTVALWLVDASQERGELELVAETAADDEAGGLHSGEPVPLRVPRATYDSIFALGPAQILRFRPGLARGPHVSMQRLGLELA